MTPYPLFYYPYDAYYDDQAPLLEAAALYFDKLQIPDPEKVSGGDIGHVAKDVGLLEDKDVGILKRVSPEEVLGDHEAAIAAAIRADLADPELILVKCAKHTRLGSKANRAARRSRLRVSVWLRLRQSFLSSLTPHHFCPSFWRC